VNESLDADETVEPAGLPRPGEARIETTRLDDPEVQGLVEQARDEIRILYWDEAPGHPKETLPVEAFLPPAGIFLLARIDGRPVGCGGYRRLEPGVAEVKRMFVTAEARRRGVARGLLEELHRAAARAGYRAMRLETGRRQPEAIALYRSAGYRPAPCYGEFRADPESLCFEKPL
jgi:GNAT superfamily N-acetyltransferase